MEEEKKVEEISSTEKKPSETEKIEEQLREQQDKYLRLLAETENTRKRMQKEKQETIRFAVENVISEFLTPLDQFESALSFAHQTSAETQTWAKGFEMIVAQFKAVLENHKVVSFPSKDHPFDPYLHEVIETEETDQYPEGVVMQEFIKGYRCGERTLRPARVKIAKKLEKKEEITNHSSSAEEEKKSKE